MKNEEYERKITNAHKRVSAVFDELGFDQGDVIALIDRIRVAIQVHNLEKQGLIIVKKEI